MYGTAPVQNKMNMLGFKITINGEKEISVASDNLVHIMMNAGHGYDIICIDGIDSKSYHLRWYKRKLRLGDKIKIRVTEIDEIDPLLERNPFDRAELIERYYTLKKELEKQV